MNNIITLTNGYYVEGATASPFTTNSYWIVFMKLDNLGNKLWYKTIGDSISEYESGFPGSFIQNNDSTFLLVGSKRTYIPGWVHDVGLMIKLNKNLDTVWSKSYGDMTSPVDSAYLFWNIIPLPEYKYAILGGVLSDVSYSKFFLQKVDSTGNVIWKKSYGFEDCNYYPIDLAYCNDGGIAMCGVYNPPWPHPIHDDDNIIIKVDNLGNQQWQKLIGGPCYDGPPMMDKTRNGNVIFGYPRSDSCIDEGDYLGKITIIEFDCAGNEIWNKSYGSSKYNNTINNIRTLDNGDFIASGHYFTNQDQGYWHTVSWILKTDSSGTEQWYREYSLLNGINSWNVLYDVNQANDNGFIACGFVFPQPPDTGIQNAWVIKVDSLGCESPGNCWVGNDEIVVKTFTPAKPFVVFPNPATEKFSVEFHENPDGADVEVYDLYGVMRFKSHLRPNGDRVDVDAGDWPPGLYLVKVLVGSRILGIEKVVVE